MGLDAHVYVTTKPLAPQGAEDTSYKNDPDDLDIGYWRSCYPLQEWASILYQTQGGKEVFCNKRVELKAEHVDELEAQLVRDAMAPPGHEDDSMFDCISGLTVHHVKALRHMFCEARKAFKAGKVVYYVSSW